MNECMHASPVSDHALGTGPGGDARVRKDRMHDEGDRRGLMENVGAGAGGRRPAGAAMPERVRTSSGRGWGGRSFTSGCRARSRGLRHLWPGRVVSPGRGPLRQPPPRLAARGGVGAAVGIQAPRPSREAAPGILTVGRHLQPEEAAAESRSGLSLMII